MFTKKILLVAFSFFINLWFSNVSTMWLEPFDLIIKKSPHKVIKHETVIFLSYGIFLDELGSIFAVQAKKDKSIICTHSKRMDGLPEGASLLNNIFYTLQAKFNSQMDDLD